MGGWGGKVWRAAHWWFPMLASAVLLGSVFTYAQLPTGPVGPGEVGAPGVTVYGTPAGPGYAMVSTSNQTAQWYSLGSSLGTSGIGGNHVTVQGLDFSNGVEIANGTAPTAALPFLCFNGSNIGGCAGTGGGGGGFSLAGTGLIGAGATVSLSVPVSVANGGTGLSNPTAHGLMVAEGPLNFDAVTCAANLFLAGVTGADPACRGITATDIATALASPPAIGGTGPNSATFSAITDTAMAGGPLCVHESGGVLSAASSDCASPGFSTAGTGLTSSGSTVSLITPVAANLGGSGVSSPAAHSILLSEGSNAFNPIACTTGLLLFGVSGADPACRGIISGDLTGALAAPPAIGGTTAAAGSFSSLTDTGLSGGPFCVHETNGLFSATASDCGSGGGGGGTALVAHTASGTAPALTCTATTGGTIEDQWREVLTGNTTYTLPASGCAQAQVMMVNPIQAASGGPYTVSFVAAGGASILINVPGGSSPPMPTTASAIAFYEFVWDSTLNIWFEFYAGQNPATRAPVLNGDSAGGVLTGNYPAPSGLAAPYGNLSYTAHTVILGEGTGNLSLVGPGAADTLLQGQGASSDPTFVSVPNCTTALLYNTATHSFSCAATPSNNGFNANDTGSGTVNGTGGGSCSAGGSFKCAEPAQGSSGFAYKQIVCVLTNYCNGGGTAQTFCVNTSGAGGCENAQPFTSTSSAAATGNCGQLLTQSTTGTTTTITFPTNMTASQSCVGIWQGN